MPARATKFTNLAVGQSLTVGGSPVSGGGPTFTSVASITKGTVSIDPPAIPTLSLGTSPEVTVTIPNAVVGDLLILLPRTKFQSGSGPVNAALAMAWISGANTATVLFYNGSSGSVSDPAAGTWDYLLIKS